MGCTAIEMSTGNKPWKEVGMIMTIFEKLSQNQGPSLENIKNEKTMKFIQKCLNMYLYSKIEVILRCDQLLKS